MVDRGKRNMISRILQKNTAIYISILAIGALLTVLFLHTSTGSISRTSYILTEKESLVVTIADTVLSREQGLSDTLRLKEGTGKLFIFDTPGTYGFWMKDMKYALDIFWIDTNWRVVDISKNVVPETYPEVFRSATPILYALEVNADEVKTNSLMIWSQLNFQK